MGIFWWILGSWGKFCGDMNLLKADIFASCFSECSFWLYPNSKSPMSPVSSRPVRRNNVHERPAPRPPWSLFHTFRRAGLLCVIVHLGIANLIASNSRFSSFGLGYNGDRAFTKQRKSGRAILFEARRQPHRIRRADGGAVLCRHGSPGRRR